MNTESTEVETAAVATEQQPLVLTELAVKMVKQALEEEGIHETHWLRVAVRGGGCSGLEYALDFDNEVRPGDTEFSFDGLKVSVDMASMTYLKGTTIDYTKSLNGQGFKFNNPNAKRSCGCGSSFS